MFKKLRVNKGVLYVVWFNILSTYKKNRYYTEFFIDLQSGTKQQKLCRIIENQNGGDQ